MNALEKLEAVLCDPEGKCCIGGSDADRQIVNESLAALRAELARPLEVALVELTDEEIFAFADSIDAQCAVMDPQSCRSLGLPVGTRSDGQLTSAKMLAITRHFAASRVPVASEGHDEKGRWEQHAEGHWNHYDAQGKLDMQSVPVAAVADTDEHPEKFCECTNCANGFGECQTATVPGGAGGSVGASAIYVCARECDQCGHAGINDEHPHHDMCSRCEWSGPAPTGDLCPLCGSEGTICAACPECGGRYRLLAEKDIKATP